jgi:SAM-dependent MidA family methyltransferase
VDLRRIPARNQDVPSDPVLLEAIRAEVRRDGPLTFARFMEIALYDPERGYYRGAVARPGRGGDFLTAPEAHPLFGRALGRFALAVHRAIGAPDELTIREYGAGTGALAGPLVEAVVAGRVRAGSDTAGKHGGEPEVRRLRYVVAEIEPRRTDAVRAAVQSALARASASASDESASNDIDVDVSPDTGAPVDGLVVANEVLDALPTHRVVQRGAELREIAVGVDPAGDLVDVERPPTTPDLAARLAAEDVRLEDGQRAEVCLALDRWVEVAAAGLRRGVLLLIDYGHASAELHDPRRRAAGTLATYLGHQVAVEPYRAIGRQDITAHVDLTAVERSAAAAGLVLVGSTSQAGFLDALGAGELLVAEQNRPGATMASYLEARAALVRMIDPAAMGRFRVLAFGRGLTSVSLPGLDRPDPIQRT